MDNGRIKLNESQEYASFPLYEESSNKNIPFKQQALQSIRSATPLSNAFFSDSNQKNLQNAIRYEVWMKTHRQHVIDYQDALQLQLIMRSIFLQYGKNANTNLTEQIEQLNRIVLNYAVPRIYTNLLQYIQYKKDITTLPEPLEHSVNVSQKGDRTLVTNRFI
jgi:hypothetical protein